jgi:ABC-2 type transport system ATP-binding protein
VADPEVYAEVQGVTKWYGEDTALDAVDLRVAAGAVHGLVGPNGAGKTTLLAAMFGLVLPDEGSVRLFGRTRAAAGSAWLDGVGGFVEAPRFYPYLTGRQNLRALARLDDGATVAGADLGTLLEQVGLDQAAADRRVRGYSLGMRQRLGLAAALLRQPRLLILDEPANGLDPVGVRDVRAAVRGLAATGVAVLLSSHDMTQVEQMCDTVTVLRRGRVAFAGTLDALRRQAPAAAWQVSTSDDVAAAALAQTVPAVAVSAVTGGLLVVADQAALDAYVLRLGRVGVAVRALAQERSPLAGLFFQLVGEDQPPAVAAERRVAAGQ